MLARTLALREQMGRLSRQIGTAKATSGTPEELLAQMKLLSAERKRLEAQLKEFGGESEHRLCPGKQQGEDPMHGAQTATGRTSLKYRQPTLRAAEISLVTDTVSDEEWDAYAACHPCATPYHFCCWRRIIETSFGHPARYLAARDARGQLVGILPMFQQSSRVFGRFTSSLPFLNYGGALGDSAEVEECMMAGATSMALNSGCRHAEFRDQIPRAGWPTRTEKVSLRLVLPARSEALWQSLPSKVRAQVRRARREQPEFVVGGAELLIEFYQVFSRNMRDLGTPVYAPEFFESVVRLAGPECRVVLLRASGKPVSGGVIVGFRDRLEIPWASTLKTANPLGINMLFYWSVLEYAVATGYRCFDFGRSTRGAGTYRFKRQWGAFPIPLYWHYGLAHADDLPRLNPDNPKYQLAVAAWRKLPLAFANRLGPWLSRSLP